jgi:hypothetical protein
MYRVRRVGVISAANMSAAISFVFTFVVALLVALVVLPMGNLPVPTGVGGPFDRTSLPTGSLVGLLLLAPLLYAAVGWVAGALAALVYNLAARFMGGLQLTLEGRAPDAPIAWTSASAVPPAAAPPPHEPPQP